MRILINSFLQVLYILHVNSHSDQSFLWGFKKIDCYSFIVREHIIVCDVLFMFNIKGDLIELNSFF